MSRLKPPAVIGEFHPRRIPLESLILKRDTKRRGVDKSPDFTLIPASDLEAGLIYFSFANDQYQIRFLKLYIRPNKSKVSLGKFLNLIFQA